MLQEPTKNRAIFNVSYSLLIEMLKLPPGTIICGVRDNALCDTVEVMVESPQLRAVPIGDQLPRIRPQYRSETRMVFDGWGE